MKFYLFLLSFSFSVFAADPFPTYYILETTVTTPSLIADNLKRKIDEIAKIEFIGKTIAHDSLLDDSIPKAKKNTRKAFFYEPSQEKEALKNNTKSNPVKKIVVEIGEIKDKKLAIQYKKYIYKNSKWQKLEFKTDSIKLQTAANDVLDKVQALSLK